MWPFCALPTSSIHLRRLGLPCAPPADPRKLARGLGERPFSRLLAHLVRRNQRPGMGGSGQVRWNRASALPEAILERSVGLGMASKNCPTAAAPGWWKG